MAVDEAILLSGIPTLRLYRWQPMCLSLGYGQRSRDADRARLAGQGWDLVRRPTGGRAILHGDDHDELTYSLSLPPDDPLVKLSIIESYRSISAALVAALESLGAQPHAERADSDLQAGAESPISPVCFETPSHYEITVAERKLIGSAQVRRKNGVLQHGALPLSGDLTRICDVLSYPNEDARQAAKSDVRAHAITLEAALGRRVDWQTVAHALATGFASILGADFTVGSLTPSEAANAARLTTEVYGSDDWTLRR
jgi:lipoate-protein ligase A